MATIKIGLEELSKLHAVSHVFFKNEAEKNSMTIEEVIKTEEFRIFTRDYIFHEKDPEFAQISKNFNEMGYGLIRRVLSLSQVWVSFMVDFVKELIGFFLSGSRKAGSRITCDCGAD